MLAAPTTVKVRFRVAIVTMIATRILGLCPNGQVGSVYHQPILII